MKTMRYVILRDDDTNALTPVDCLERLYRPFLNRGLPVNPFEGGRAGEKLLGDLSQGERRREFLCPTGRAKRLG